MATFVETFEAQTVGNAPSGWTNQWGALGAIVQQDGPVKVAQWNQSANARARISNDAAGNAVDGEILVKMRLSALYTTGSYAWVSGRISGAAGTENAVSAYFGTLSGNRQVRLHQYINGSTTTDLAAVNLTGIDLTAYFWVRFKYEGANLYVRVWQDGASEPTAWTLTATNATLLSTGLSGVGGITGGNNIATNADYISFATTAAESAPAPPPATKSASITLQDASGAALANLTGIRWAFFDQTDPSAFASPVNKGGSGTTNSAGLFTAPLGNTGLAIGQTGSLVLQSGDGLSGGIYTVSVS